MRTRFRLSVMGFLVFFGADVRALDLHLEGSVETIFMNNMFLDIRREADFLLETNLDLELQFIPVLSSGYEGSVEIYTIHRDFFFHAHRLYLMVAPVFGDARQHELRFVLSLQTQRNTRRFQRVNTLGPLLEIILALEPKRWFSLELYCSGEYRWLYDYPSASSVDVWCRSDWIFSTPTRTTITPGVAYGFRYFPIAHETDASDRDQQMILDIHISQGLSKHTGLQFLYSFVHNFHDNTLVARQMDSMELSFVSDQFLYSGHSAQFGTRHYFTEPFSMFISAAYASRRYDGWEAWTMSAEPTGQDRQDHLVSGQGTLEYEWSIRKLEQRSVGFLVGLGYEYLRQWSNDPWYDTDRHFVHLFLQFDR